MCSNHLDPNDANNIGFAMLFENKSRSMVKSSTKLKKIYHYHTMIQTKIEMKSIRINERNVTRLLR